MQEMQVQSLGWEDPRKEEVATHSSILAWKIPWTGTLDGLQSHGVAKSLTHLSTHALAVKRQPTEWEKIFSDYISEKVLIFTTYREFVKLENKWNQPSLKKSVGLHPTGLQALYLPNFKTKERAQSQQQRLQWFNVRKSSQVWNKLLNTGQDLATISAPRKKITTYEEIDVRWAH